MSVKKILSKLENDTWPQDGLESVQECPICYGKIRKLCHADLLDNVSFVAPGKWKLWRCVGCTAAYLDPRPTTDSIHLAYENYYTHSEEDIRSEDYLNLSFRHKLIHRMLNGYANWKFGAKLQPSSILGLLYVPMQPIYRDFYNISYRHLPKCPADGGDLLDIGCGDGSFLKRAKACGWRVIGLDPDPHVAANGVNQGLQVHQGDIEFYKNKKNLFDVITMNHVIEHVHQPQMVLKLCFDLLKPGGILWIETPNINSYGYEIFGKDWRGIEAPRHLVIFNRRSLWMALSNAGFNKITENIRINPSPGMFEASYALQQNESPYSKIALPSEILDKANAAIKLSALFRDKSEFITLTATKD